MAIFHFKSRNMSHCDMAKDTYVNMYVNVALPLQRLPPWG